MPNLKLSARRKSDVSPLEDMIGASEHSGTSSAASAFSPAAYAISIKPLPRYTIRLEPFPPLLGLIAYVCNIDYTLEINEDALERILHGVQREFIKYHKRIAHKKSTRPSHDQILGYLNFILIRLDELFEDPVLNKKMKETNSKIYQLFSNALSLFLKNTRSPKAMDDFLFKEYSTDVVDDTAMVIPSKPKLSETGRRLIGHIKAQKIYDVGTILRNKPEVAIEWDQTMTILTDAAFNGHVGILELIIATLRDLALRGKLPEDYYGRLVGKGSDNKLPALLWAAINGQLQALQYLCSIPEIRTSIRLIELDEVIEETSELHEEEEKPNSFNEICSILRALRAELTSTPAPKEESVEPQVGMPVPYNKREIKLLIKAIHNKELEKVEALLTANPSMVLYKDLKKSILSEAACFGNPEIVQLIISRCPTDYDFGELLGEDEPTKLQSAVLMSALACQFAILQYLLAIPSVFKTIAQRDIFSALKKIEDYVTEKMDRSSPKSAVNSLQFIPVSPFVI